jgi:hypothetical protein
MESEAEESQQETPELVVEIPPEEVVPEDRPVILDLTSESSLSLLSGDSAGDDGEPRGKRFRRGKRDRSGKDAGSDTPSTAPPSASEWQDFFGGVVLRALTQGYLQLVLFRDIDESELTPRERELIELTKDDLRDIAAPMATMASKSKYARKHGRSVIAAAESYESVVDLFIWMRRVNKIARKHRKNEPTVTLQGTAEDVNGPVSGQDQPSGPVNSTGIFNRGTG